MSGQLVRVYLPATVESVRDLLGEGQLAGPLDAFTVTPALRESYAEGDIEELEYVALTAAAQASLGLLRDAAGAPPRRMVVAADVPPDAVAPRPSAGPGAVTLAQSVPLGRVAALHADDVEAEADVRAAVAALDLVAAGDEDAAFTVVATEGHELLWYATQEAGDLVADLLRD